MASGGGDGWEVSSVGNHWEGRGVAWVWWRAWWVPARTHIIHQPLSGSVRFCLAGVATAENTRGGVISSATYGVRSIRLLILETIPVPSARTRLWSVISICPKITPTAD